MAPLGLVDGLDRAAGNVAGVVHQDVDVAAVLGKLAQRRTVAQVDRMGLDVAAQLTRSLAQAVRVARCEMQAAALGGEGLGAGEADAFRAAGDQD